MRFYEFGEKGRHFQLQKAESSLKTKELRGEPLICLAGMKASNRRGADCRDGVGGHPAEGCGLCLVGNEIPRENFY